MTNATVHPLREPGDIDPTTVLTGPLRRIRRVRLNPGERVTLTADGFEFTLFVLSGGGTGNPGTAAFTLRHGVSVTAPLRAELHLVAGDEGLEYFLAELTVREES
ncbi:hypothetical protein [Amycolatopsis cihanbeyliensis]|uniref:Uncharacterized protein n=1 Tax=Amycolatopsis cihanbeyliensis TaxID=1128664 RepID=A0A542DIF0_AMYCI|nr:hypothetical protein [Amycolatopsis cihanbeyliensis]TQJ02784.1 hypothetical protein FB471_2529 [Amycolatopsis cihanbeyliensis]